MATDLYQQTLALAGRFRGAVRLDSHVIPERASEKNVVPAADVQRGDLDIREVLLDGPLLPICGIGGMREPIEIIRRDVRRDLGAFRTRRGVGRRVVSE